MNTSTRIDRLEAKTTADSTDPIASGRYVVSMQLNFDGGPATYELTDTTTGEPVPMTADLVERVEALERAKRKTGQYEDVTLVFRDHDGQRITGGAA